MIHKVETSEKVSQSFNKVELEDISQIHKYRSHIEHAEIYEKTLIDKKHILIEKETFDSMHNVIKETKKLWKFNLK